MNITPCLSHVSLGTNKFDAAAQFYDRVLGALDCRRVMEHPGAIGYGRDYPEFWLQVPIDGKPGSRPHYGAAYYGCFVRDLDGHKIEASFWDESAA